MSVWRRRVLRILVAFCLFGVATPLSPASATAAPGAVAAGRTASASSAAAAGGEGNQLESAARKAGETGRKVAMSLIALGFAIAAVVLAFRRDFKEAVAVFAIGVVAVLFAQAAGVKLIENLVRSLFGA
ncbi:MAG TPA: hypothetical protein VKU89_09755 [Solirubrobacteraceae bacterium]|nr:hypothetical protein [Solirubrobacteraceae bacterium]